MQKVCFSAVEELSFCGRGLIGTLCSPQLQFLTLVKSSCASSSLKRKFGFIFHKKKIPADNFTPSYRFPPLYMKNLTGPLSLSAAAKQLGRFLIFMVPSAPQEKMWLAGPTSICITPVPRFLNSDCRACSLGKV